MKKLLKKLHQQTDETLAELKSLLDKTDNLEHLLLSTNFETIESRTRFYSDLKEAEDLHRCLGSVFENIVRLQSLRLEILRMKDPDTYGGPIRQDNLTFCTPSTKN